MTNTPNADIIPAMNPLNVDRFSVPSHLKVDFHSMLNPQLDNPSEPKLLIVCWVEHRGGFAGNVVLLQRIESSPNPSGLALNFVPTLLSIPTRFQPTSLNIPSLVLFFGVVTPNFGSFQ